jgi:endonuclease YncB( thermonuclease family)
LTRRIDRGLAVFTGSMRRLALLIVCGLALAAAPAAEARSGSCLVPGVKTKCSIWTGKVVYITDGDTVYVDLLHDGSDRVVTVRFTGINAMEQTVYSANPARRRGFCHAVQATSRLEQLIRGGHGVVRLAALDASSASRKRWRRAVAVRIGGRWRDVQRILLSEGLAVWLPNAEEWIWNASYSTLAERAAAAHRGVWKPTACGRGPEDWAHLALTLNGDADGIDGENLNGEWVRIRNLDPARSVHLGGWSLRDSAPGGFKLPDWVTIPPGEALTVHVGTGEDTWTEVFEGLRRPIFENATGGGHGVGDSALLLDPQGDIRAWAGYPCRLNCADPHQGALKVTADPAGRESVTVRNLGPGAVDLDGYRLWSPPHVYAFPPASVVGPGEGLRVDVVGDPDEDAPLVKFWGKAGPILNDRGDVVRLTNLRGTELDCYAFGAATC